MIINEVKGSSGKAQLVIPEDPDDLFTLRRILEIGDNVIADTTRVVKQVKEFARPDKGERIKVKIVLDVQEIGLDGAVGRLRIGGLILKSDNELVTRGQHHNLTISVGDVLTLSKNRRWKQSEFDIIKRSTSSPFILVAIDTQEAAVALITGTHLRILPNIYSGQSGKRYSTVRKHNTGMEAFFEEVAGTTKTLLARDVPNQIVIIFGPGETKRRFHNYLQAHLENTNTTNNNRINMKVIDGVDVAGEDGIHVSLRSDSLKEVMKDTKLGNVAIVLDKVFFLVSKGIPKFAIGINEVSKAAELKSIEHLLYSDTLFHSATEEQVIALLNRVDAIGAKTYAIDSSTDIGLRVSSLGGIVALLRFAIN